MSGITIGKQMTAALRKGCESKGLPADCEFFLCGIRRVFSSKADLFDDILIAVGKDDAYAFKGTTKPGWKGTQNPVSYKGVTGAAWVVPGVYIDVYQLGIHGASNPNFAHEAFRQVGMFRFARDTNCDGDIDVYEPEQEGVDTCINFHRASKYSDVEYIGAYGIGCQVAQSADALEFAIKMFKATDLYKKNAKPKVTYVLLTEEEFSQMGCALI